MSEKNTNKEEEVDLGSLFIIIGNGFSKLFGFIGSLLSKIFNFIIQVLLFLKNNFLKIGIASIIGFILGFILETQGETKYVGNLQVQPNFESTRQLYNNINYYNDLVQQEEIGVLAKTFNITEEESRSLKSFSIKPVINNNDVLVSYDELILSIDTLTVKNYSFVQFKNTFTEYDYKTYNIDVKSTLNNIFVKLDETIIESITENKYFENLKKINDENLNTSEKLIRKNLNNVDSLHSAYRKVLLQESNKNSNGTNISLGNSTTKNSRELDLFEIDRELNLDLKEVSENLTEKSEIINIISNFQPIGHEVKEIQENKAFQFAIIGILLMILALVILKLNKYLNKYKI